MQIFFSIENMTNNTHVYVAEHTVKRPHLQDTVELTFIFIFHSACIDES